jgi:hypothetical protein
MELISFDRDGKLGAVVCEGARCAIDEAIKERGETITRIIKWVKGLPIEWNVLG